MRNLAVRITVVALTACGSPESYTREDPSGLPESITGQALASACSGCHVTGGVAISDLNGWNYDALNSGMEFYRLDAEGSSVMHRLARGYSAAEIALIAKALSSAKEEQP